MSADQRLLERAHTMRREPTETQKRLWRHLSNAQLGGHKFRRQAVIGRWIVDFLCPAKALIVEVDGDTHDAERDAARDAMLARAGYCTLRFANMEIVRNMDGVLAAILSAANAAPDRWPGRGRVHHPNPSSEEEGLPVASSPDLSPSSFEEGLRVSPSPSLSPSSSEEGLGVVASSFSSSLRPQC